MIRFAAALAVVAALAPAAFAETAPDSHADPHAGHAMPSAQASNAATAAYQAANAAMHEGMAIPFTGDADVDFIAGMIPHHQGAVEMAKIVMEHGKDPEVRALAEKVIAAQEAEISWMQAWLAQHSH